METDPDLPLTWERCHPATRELLLDAVVWDPVDEAGPNASEPGLAALERLAGAISASAEAIADERCETRLRAILGTLLRDAALHDVIAGPPAGLSSDLSSRVSSDVSSGSCFTDDELSEEAIGRDDLLLGYAFASLKLVGRCPAPLLSAACQAIDRQNDPAMLALRAPDDPERFMAQRIALRTILECAAIHRGGLGE